MTAHILLAAIYLIMGFSSVDGISNSGNEFYLMFPPNLGGRSPKFPPILFVTTDDDESVEFTVSYNKANPRASGTSTHTATKGELTRIELPEALKDSFVGFAFDGGINLKAEEGKNIIVYGLNEDSASTDVYLGLPYFETKTGTYDYYGVSVPRSNLEPKPTNGYMAIVTLEDNTVLSITPTVTLEGFVHGTPLRKMAGTTYISIPRGKGVTFLLRSREDLTGTKISSNNPITFITGHECGFLPSNVTACDHLTEQLPPAETFGFKFVLVPLRLRQQDGYKIVASRDGTMVHLNCVNKDGDNVQKELFSLNEGQFKQLFIHSDRYCTLESNLPLLVVQIALGHSFDEVGESDPFMTMVPPLGQYRNDYTLLFVESFSVDTRDDPVIFEPRLSVSVPSSCFNHDQILFDGQAFPDSAEFVPVQCEDGEVCAYAAQYQVPTAQSRGAHTLKHSDPSCTVGVIVYGYERENTYGYPGGMNLDSIAAPNYCFKDAEVKVCEQSGVLEFTLENTGIPVTDCVTFSTTAGTAIRGTNYDVANSTCCFEGGSKLAKCSITILEAGITGTRNFNVTLDAKDGQCVCDTPLIVIISDCKEKEVNFNPTKYTVREDGNHAILMLELDVAAPTECTVTVVTKDISAEDGLDYNGGASNATFGPGSSEAKVLIPIEDDNITEQDESFTVIIMDNVAAGVKAGANSRANVTITDNDKQKIVNFNPTEYFVNEDGNFAILILMLNAPAEENCTVVVETSEGSALNGSDFIGGSYSVIFQPGSSKADLRIPIINDTQLEEDETFLAVIIPGSGVIAGENSLASVTIIEDDKVYVNFSPVEYNINEGAAAGKVNITLVASASLSQSYMVNVTTVDGNATGGDDYESQTYLALFPAGEVVSYILVDITDDTFIEGTEYFNAQLSVPQVAGSLGVRAGDNSKATVYIIDDGEEVFINFSPVEYTYNEGDANAILTLQATRAMSENYTVIVTTSDGSANDGSDYTGGEYVATFLAGEMTAFVSIPLLDDEIAELTEDFFGILSIPNAAQVLGVKEGPDYITTVNISNNDIIEVNFANTTYNVEETIGYATLTLTANALANFNYTVLVNTADGSAVDVEDYAGGQYEAFFLAGSTSAQVQIPIIDDRKFEGRDENFTAQLSIMSGTEHVIAGSDDVATIKILDHEQEKFVNFSPTQYTVSEDGNFTILNLTASAPASHAYQVYIQTNEDRAKDGSDYIGGNFSVTFAQESTEAELYIPIVNDGLPEPDEIFTATLIVPEDSEAAQLGIRPGEDSEATVTITDDDKKIINFNPTEYSVSEDGTNAILMLMLNAPAEENCTVQVLTIDGTAEDGPDYTGGVYNLTFTKGSSKAELHIPIIDDDIPEPDETFTAMLMIPDTAEGVEVGEDSIATVTIKDDDIEKIVNFNPTEYFVIEDGTSAVLMLMLNAPAEEECTVVVQTSEGSALDGSDFIGGNYSVTFQPGRSKEELHIPIINDTQLEEDETFSAAIIPGSGVLAGEDRLASITILDDAVFVNFSPVEYTYNEGDGNAILTLEATSAISEDYFVIVTTSDGSAIDGRDYVGGQYEATFFAEETTVTLSIPLVDDKEFGEGIENFLGELTIPEAAQNYGVRKGINITAKVNIEDQNEVKFAPTTYNVEETIGFATLSLTASRQAGENYTVFVNTTNGLAVDGEDYLGGQYVAFFIAGSTSAQVQIPIINDRNFEGRDESFTAQLIIPSGRKGVIAGSDDEATINITDNELEIFVDFCPTRYTVSEGGNIIILNICASAPASHAYTVHIETKEGSAKSGLDYIRGNFSITISRGMSEAESIILIVNDSILEPDEFFTATLSLHEEAAMLGVKPGNDREATVTIKDDDSKIVNFNPTEYSVSEDGTSAVLMLMLNAPAGENCIVQVQTRDGSALDGSDFIGGSYSVTFQPGSSKEEIHIPIINDTQSEEDETFLVAIVSRSGVFTGEGFLASVTINDDDKIMVFINFSPVEYTYKELDGIAILTLDATSAVSEDYVVIVSTNDGSATDGSDYTGGVYNVTFTKGSSKAELRIPIIDDDIPEPDETFTAMLMIPDSAEGVNIGDNSSASVKIKNDDEEIVVFFDPEEYMANETNGLVVITVKASRCSSKTYTVMIDTQDGSAKNTDDYSGGPFPTVFSPNETKVQIMIPLKNDDMAECDEGFFGHLRIPQEAKNMGVRSGDANTATVTVKDDDTFDVNFVETIKEVFEHELKIIVCLEHNRKCLEEFTVQIGNRPHPSMSASSTDDYQNGPYDVLFENGKNRSCVEIPVIDDGVEEGPENFQLEIIPAGDGGPPFQPGLKSMAQVTVMDGNIDGDPMFTVPLNIDRKMLSKFSQKDKQWDLCYEVHGRGDKIYNLVSDQCVFVNTHLKMASNPKVGNIMVRIGIMAMDRDGKCHRILADLDGNILTVNGVDVGGRWMRGGIIVHKFGDKVDVAVPNCKGRRMVFSIIFHYMNGADMIKFIIADGRGLSPSSHGLIGQFWNTPVEIQEVSGKWAKTGRQYKVVIYSPFTGPREFIGDYYPMTWDYQKTPCLYAGTKNGVPVIEGKFTKYEVKNLFDPKFDYSQFSQDHCSK